MTKTTNRKAFSLIEISVVIVIIGVLIAGISSGIELYDDYKLKIAQNITKNSRVNRIPDLEMWLETTTENSLATGTTSFADRSNPADKDSIGRWNDLNPNIIATAKNNATQDTSADNQPKYVRNVVNGLPALKFDGVNDFFSFNGNFLAGSDYTIFVVETRGSSKSLNFFISGFGTGDNSILHIGYRSSSIITQGHNNNDLDCSILNFTSPIASIHTFLLRKASGKSIYQNGILKASNAQKIPLISYEGASIGGNNRWGYYNGSIAEMIFYSRALNDQERQGVEVYLSKKWGIKVG